MTIAEQRQDPSADHGEGIRPFRIEVTDDELQDLRRRVRDTRWPERELVGDATQGVQLSVVKALAEYWLQHDWRDVERRLNALPQFMTEIDGLDIHFIHVKSLHPDAL